MDSLVARCLETSPTTLRRVAGEVEGIFLPIHRAAALMDRFSSMSISPRVEIKSDLLIFGASHFALQRTVLLRRLWAMGIICRRGVAVAVAAAAATVVTGRLPALLT